MLHETITIDIDFEALGIIHNDNKATITTYILDSYPEYQGEKKRPLVIICPGGGYEHHSPREGEAIAIKMNSFGFNACILKYSLIPNEFPCALFEAAYTIAYARAHANEWSIDPTKIIMAGFSSGAHVTASLGTMWNKEILKDFVTDTLKLNPKDVRPDGMLLGYPVITSGEYAHRPSFVRILGKDYDKNLELVSLENRVDAETPITFLWHTFEDSSVLLENSFLFANALRENKVPFELHVFPNGSHGLGLATRETDMKDGSKYQPECACWVDMFKVWVEKNI